jgi:hypothetical protein
VIKYFLNPLFIFCFVIGNLAYAQSLEKIEEIDAQKPLLVDKVSNKQQAINVIKSGDEGALQFEWNNANEIGAAAFVKGGMIYLAFDQEANFSLINTQNNYPDFVDKISQMEAPKGFSLLVIKMKLGYGNKKWILRKNDEGWVLQMATEGLRTLEPFRVKSMPLAAPFPRVEIIANQDISAKFYIKNKRLGKVMLVPLREDNRPNNTEYKFTDFSILPSIQGMAIEVGADTLTFSTQKERLLIESSGGLNISRKGRLNSKNREENWLGTNEADSLLNMRKYLKNEWQPFSTQLRELNEKLYTELEDEQFEIYSELATFYLANELYLEAASIIHKLKKLNYEIYNNDYRLRLIEVVANFMQEKYYEAFALMNAIDVINSDLTWRKELRFWQTITKAMILQQHSASAKSNIMVNLFTESRGNFLSSYPLNMWFAIGLAILHEQIKVNSENVMPLIRFIAKFTSAKKESAESLLISKRLINRFYGQVGKYYWQNNKFDDANDYYNRCIEDIDDNLNRTRCRFHLLQMQLENNNIKPSEAINEMQKLTTLWRGDDLEIEMQQFLAELYLQNKESTNALETWRMIVDNFPNTPEALQLSGRISTLITEMIIGAKEVNLTPYQAVSLYYRFQDYIPYGELGDELILRVANNLISLDLLEQAEKLLSHQVNNRLMGTRKEEVINLLAYILLRNLKYNDVIEVINWGDKYEHLPNYIAKPRKYIHARALVALENEKKAIEMLDGDYSPEADEILQDIFWQSQRWEDFNKVSEPYVYRLRKSQETLTESQAKQVAKQSISYLMLGKTELFDDLLQDIIKLMPEKSIYTDLMLQMQMFAKDCQDKSCNHGLLDIESLQNIVMNLAKDIK